MRIPRSLGLLSRSTFIMLLVSGTLAFPTQNIPRELDSSKAPPTKRQFNSSLDGPELSYNYFAAIGDSYAAGLGAGHVMDRNCKRYNQSYANLINGDPRLGDQDEVGRRFDNLACAGATIRDVLEKQISWLDDGVDAMTITTGGNDVGFGAIVDSCIFGFGRTPCEQTMQTARTYIRTALPVTLDRLLKIASAKLTPGTGRIYITGYAQFFNEATTQCDSVSIALFGRKKLLDQSHRARYNELIRYVNAEIAHAAGRAGPQVIFVDYDWYFGACDGRLCEADVFEPDPNRPNLLIFERKGNDVPLDPPAMMGKRNFLASLTKRIRIWWLSDSELRVFHPRSNGQRLIANVVLSHMQAQAALFRGVAAAPLSTHDVCPA